MKKFLIILLTFFIGCNSIEEEKPLGLFSLKGINVSLFQPSNTNNRINSSSQWKHIYQDRLTLYFQNIDTGEETILEIDPNDFHQPYNVQLIQGEYSVTAISEGNNLENYLPFETNGTFSIGSEPQEVELEGGTDYSLVTISAEYAESASIFVGNDSKELPLTSDSRYFYQYVLKDQNITVEVLEKFTSNAISQEITTSDKTHFHFNINYPEVGNLNFIELILQDFHYMEEEIILGQDINEFVRDADGNVYKIVKIGNQIWMAENLRTGKFCNGDEIQKMIPPSERWDITFDSPAFYNLGYDSKYDEPFGRLYNMPAATDERNICPCGWEIPSLEDWRELRDYLGGPVEAAQKMQSPNNLYWFPKDNPQATNESGFNALGSGLFIFNWSGRYYRNFYYVKERASWWSSTETIPTPWDLIVKVSPVTILNGEFFISEENITEVIDQGEDMTFRSIRCIKK